MRKLLSHIDKDTLNTASIAIVGAATALLIAGIIYYIQENRQRVAIDTQTTRIEQLIKDVKDISEQNKALNVQNRNYTYCNAVLLARYTQDQEPIVIDDLNKCILSSFDGSGSTSPQPSLITPQNPPEQHTEQPQPTTGNPQTPRNPNGSPNTPNDPQNVITVPGVLEVSNSCIMVLNNKICK